MFINSEGVIQTTKEELQAFLKEQSDITLVEIATYCANLCDVHRGHLQVGDMIRQHFGIENVVQHLEPVPENKKSHLRRVK